MWTIIKFDNKKYHLLKKELKTKLGEKCKIYKPKVLINRFIAAFRKMEHTPKNKNLCQDFLRILHTMIYLLGFTQRYYIYCMLNMAIASIQVALLTPE